MSDDHAPVDLNAAAPDGPPKRRWWRDPALVVILVLVAAPFAIIRLNHRPQLVYPEGAKRLFLKMQTTNGRPINPELVEYYTRMYGLEPEEPCIEGKKYATVCQDGEVIWRVEDGVCAEHGGLKDWVVCR